MLLDGTFALQRCGYATLDANYMISTSNESVGYGDKAIIDEVATFVRVVRHGSLAGAARELGVPKSTVSRRLGRLETALQVKLLHRGARSFTLTAEGNRLFDSVRASIDTVEQAIHVAQQGGALPRGNIRVTAPDDFGRLQLLDELVAFGDMWPEITFEVDLSNRYVDVVQEGYDLAIRATSTKPLPGTGNLITRKLRAGQLHIAGSTSGPIHIESIEELTSQPFVLFRQPSRRQRIELTGSDGRKCQLTVEGRFVVNDFSAMAKLVAQGAGYGLMPGMHIDAAPSSLRRVLPDYHAASGHIALVYPSRQLPRRVALLIEHLSQRIGEPGS